MIRSKSEYEKFVIQLLNIIISGRVPLATDFPEYEKIDFQEVLFQCVKDGLIVGYSINRTANGRPVGQQIGTPYVTFKGLSYMDSVRQAQAVEIAAAAEDKSIRASLRANMSFILSGLSIAIAVLTNLDKIASNVQKLISYLSSL